MTRVLPILTAAFALAVTAAPASAASMEPGRSALFVPIPYPVTGGLHDNVSDQTYMNLEMKNVLIKS
jgi:hypothetical protein